MIPAFIQRVRTDRTDWFLRVQIEELTSDHIEWWDTHITPDIEKLESRPDQEWDWATITSGWLSGTLATNLNQQPKGFAVTYTSPQDNTIVIALAYIVQRYHYLPNPTQKASYLWYLSKAPSTRKGTTGRRSGKKRIRMGNGQKKSPRPVKAEGVDEGGYSSD